MKECTYCKEQKEYTMFYENRKDCKSCVAIKAKLRYVLSGNRSEYRAKNREKLRESGNRYYHNNKSKVRATTRKSQLKNDFNITPDDYKKMLMSQDGKCKICGKSEKIINRGLAVDHCHETGRVRGLLCNSCNLGLGKFKDSIEVLEKALEYLKQRS